MVVAAAHRGLGLAQAMLAAMLECVRALEPAYGRELFLTAMQRTPCSAARASGDT